MQRFDDAQIGDLGYSRLFGDWEVVVVLENGITVTGVYENIFIYKDGRQGASDIEPTNFYRSGEERYLTERPKRKKKIKKTFYCNGYTFIHGYEVHGYETKEKAKDYAGIGSIFVAQPCEFEWEEEA